MLKESSVGRGKSWREEEMEKERKGLKADIGGEKY